MATKSFYEDMVIDTPEKAAAIEELFAHPEKYTYHCTGKLNFRWATREEMDQLMAPYIRKRDDSGDDNDNAEHDATVRIDSDLWRISCQRSDSGLCVCA